MVFSLPKLPWPEAALAPRISVETIQYHYGKHHQAYVNKLNGDLVQYLLFILINHLFSRLGQRQRMGKEIIGW